MIGSINGTATTYDLTDAEGSVLTSLSSSAVLGEQIYGPYGNQRYTQGTMGTDKGYTGQFQDVATGLDYYNARYYDPVMGQFLSADNVQGNAQGFDPYSYVNGNPETATDPTGQRISCPPDCGGTGSNGGGTPCTLGPNNGCNSAPLTSCDSDSHLSGGSCEQNSKPTNNCPGCVSYTVPTANQQSGPKKPTTQQIDDARDDASKAGGVFTAIGVGLGAIALLAGKTAGVLQQFAAYLWGLVAAMSATLFGIAGAILLGIAATIVTAAAVTFATLALSAAAYALLATGVSAEFWIKSADHDSDTGAWSPSAMENFQKEVDDTIAGGAAIITTTVTLYTYIKGMFAPGSALMKVLPTSVSGLVIPLAGGLGVNIALGAGLFAAANNTIGAMNSDLGY